MKFPIPDAALASHIAILGKTGSGKTSTEKLIVEHVVAEGARVCVLDTVKSDWWGITSSASGKSAGLPFKILGGPRGHVPLHSSAGKVIGHLVATRKLPLSIVDMADFEPGGIQRFFVDFAQSLFRHIRGVVYLVVEEAHEVAPKERVGFGAENLAIHWAKKLATAARSKGIRLIVATQSVQQLHNRVLGSCETLIAHRLTTPADQEPIVKWMKANAEKKKAEEVEASLSSLPTGDAWVCSGEAKFFGQVRFPKFKTYDNTATPTDDGAEVDVKTAPVDQNELRTLIGDAVRDAEADDPKKLRAEIAKLKTDLAKKPTTTTTTVADQGAIAAARREGVTEGHARGLGAGKVEAYAGFGRDIRALQGALAKLMTGVKSGIEHIERSHGTLQTWLDVIDELKTEASKSVSPTQSVRRNATEPMAPAKREIPAAAPRATPSPGAGGDDTLTNPQRTLLASLTWWRAMGHEEPTYSQAAAIAGWSPKGSNLRDRLSELATRGLIERPRARVVRLTPAGIAAAPAPDTSKTLHDSIRGILTAPQLKVFDVLVSLPGAVDRAELAGHVGWEASGSNLRDRLSELSGLEIIARPDRNTVALQEWVTP